MITNSREWDIVAVIYSSGLLCMTKKFVYNINAWWAPFSCVMTQYSIYIYRGQKVEVQGHSCNFFPICLHLEAWTQLSQIKSNVTPRHRLIVRRPVIFKCLTLHITTLLTLLGTTNENSCTLVALLTCYLAYQIAIFFNGIYGWNISLKTDKEKWPQLWQ